MHKQCMQCAHCMLHRCFHKICKMDWSKLNNGELKSKKKNQVFSMETSNETLFITMAICNIGIPTRIRWKYLKKYSIILDNPDIWALNAMLSTLLFKLVAKWWKENAAKERIRQKLMINARTITASTNRFYRTTSVAIFLTKFMNFQPYCSCIAKV